MERSIQLIVAGGLVGVLGFWTLNFAGDGETLWYVGAAMIALGALAIAGGIVSDLRTGPGV